MSNADLNEQIAYDLLNNESYAEDLRINSLTPEEKSMELDQLLLD